MNEKVIYEMRKEFSFFAVLNFKMNILIWNKMQ